MPNQDYWKERFETLNESLLKDGMDYYDEAEQIFRRAQRSIDRDIAAWYQRFADNNKISLQDAQKLLRKDELEEFKWTVEDYIKHGRENGVSADWSKQLENASARFHISRLEALKIEMQHHLEELYGNYLDGLDGALRRTYQDSYYKTCYTMQEGYHTGFEVASLPESAVDAVIKKPWAADGLNFSDRIWRDKDKLLRTLQDELTQGLIRGDRQDDIVRRFAKRMGVSLSNAGRLIATESAFFAAKGELDNMKELGVEKYQFIATLDRRTSDICRSMDMKIIPVKDFQPGVTAPPLHCWCRSCTVPYMAEAEGLRAARDEEGKTTYIPDMPYKDWKEIYVDKKKTLEQYLHEVKIQMLEKKVESAEKALNRAKDAMQHAPGYGKSYEGIFPDPVTVEDWGGMRDIIDARRYFFNVQGAQKLKRKDLTGAKKYRDLLLKLNEFDRQGKEYARLKEAYLDADKTFKRLKDELDALRKNQNGGTASTAEIFSDARKKAAHIFRTPQEGDAYLRKVCGEVWRNASKEERDAICSYTSNSYVHYNRVLSGYELPKSIQFEDDYPPEYLKGAGNVSINNEGYGEKIRRMTDIIAKSAYDKDVWLRRGTSLKQMDELLGLPPGTFEKKSLKEMKDFCGNFGNLQSFLSCGAASGKGFNGQLIMRIFAPKGTEMMYTEPFSANGLGFGRNWDGVQKQTLFSREFEIIIQRGAKYKMVDIYQQKNGKYVVELEVHPELGYNKFQQDE